MIKDIQTLKEISKLLKKAFISLDDIEDVEKIFNSNHAIEVIKKHPSITTSLDDLIFDLFNYFEELASIHKKNI